MSENGQTYIEKLRDPRWQKKRLKILERDQWACVRCGNKEQALNVHHTYYENWKAPWKYPNYSLITLCNTCHDDEKNNRKGHEEKLLRILRIRFSPADVLALAETFDMMPMVHLPEVVIDGLGWFLTEQVQMQSLMYSYLHHLKERVEAGELSREDEEWKWRPFCETTDEALDKDGPK